MASAADEVRSKARTETTSDRRMNAFTVLFRNE
jgi:hypothetical protein